MKPTSVKLLQDICTRIDGAFPSSSEVIDMIKQVIMIESNCAKIGKFNLFDYVSDDPDHLAIMSVYHDSGYKVATDSKIIVAIKSDYPEFMEHKLVAKDGKVTDKYYPKWDCVFPADEKSSKPVVIDRKKFLDGIERVRAEHTIEYGKSVKWDISFVVQIDNVYLGAKYFSLLLQAMDALGTDKLLIHEKGRCVWAKTDLGKVMLMPRCMVDDHDKIIKL